MTHRIRMTIAASAVLGLAILLLPITSASADPTDPATPGGGSGTTQSQLEEQAIAALDAVEDLADPDSGSSRSAADQDEPSRDLTMELRELALTQQNLPKNLQPRAGRLLSRPTDSGGCRNDLACYDRPASRRCVDIVCVQYVQGNDPNRISGEDDGAGGAWKGIANNGVPDYVEFVSSVMSKVVTTYDGAGYRRPVGDGAAGGGGTNKVDIYLADLGSLGYYGYCTTDEDVEAHVAAAAYCVLDNDYSPYEFGTAATPAQNLQVTAAHEYFHAVQFAYDVAEDAWLMEATATWAEDEVYGSINDNRQYLSDGPLGMPHRPLNAFIDLSAYGTWIFFRFLGERYPTTKAGMSTIVRDIWDRLPGETYSLEGIHAVLAARGSTLPAQLAWFNVWNRRPASYYSEGAAYRPAPTRGAFALNGQRPKKVVSVNLNHLSSSTYRFTRPTTGGQWRLQIKLNLSAKEIGAAAVVSLKVKGHSPTTKVLALNANGDATYTYPFRTNVEWIDITPINTSSSYRDCGTLTFDEPSTCRGLPVHDAQTQTISALAYSG